jgi:hypothetical protein
MAKDELLRVLLRLWRSSCGQPALVGNSAGAGAYELDPPVGALKSLGPATEEFFLGLRFAKKFDLRRTWQNPGLGAAFDQFRHCLTALFSITQRPFVDIHAHELVR